MMQNMSEEMLAVMQEDDQNSLEHYGVKGQKWGQRNYQNPDGTYTDLGKERRRVKFIREEKAKKEADANAHQNGIEESIDTDVKIGGKAYKDMTRKELRAAKKRARHNEAERRAQREFNRDKKQALEDGDIAFISKNISKFTNEEIDAAMVRYKKMQDLKNLDKANQKDANHYIDKALHYLDKASQASKSISNIANNFNDMSKKAAEKKKAWIDYEYTKDPSLKPLTEKEKLDVEKQKTINKQSEETLAKMREATLQEQEKTRQARIDSANKRSSQQAELTEIEEKARKARIDNDMLEQEVRQKKFEADQKAVERDQKKFDLDMQKKAVKDLEKAEDDLKKQLKDSIKREMAFEEKELRAKLKEVEEEKREAERKEKEARKAEKEATNRANAELKEYLRKLDEQEENEKEQKRLEKEQARKQKEIERTMQEEAKNIAKQNEVEKQLNSMTNEEYWNLMYSGQSKNQSKLGSFFSKKDKDKVHKDNDQDFDPDDKGVNIVTRKYLNQLKNSPKDYFKENQVQTDQWKKDLKKYDADVIDKWVKDMKKKYMKERNMDSKAAEQKAEEYVDSWLDAYDEGLF